MEGGTCPEGWTCPGRQAARAIIGTAAQQNVHTRDGQTAALIDARQKGIR
jgi:hypothetical protein